MSNSVIINKTMDVDDIMGDFAIRVRKELNDLVYLLEQKKLKISSWYGQLDTFVGGQNLPFRADKDYAALSINSEQSPGFSPECVKRIDLSEPDDLERINRGYDYRSIEGLGIDKRFPWFLYWEIIWLFLNNDFSPDSEILDLGGSSSLFSYYLASKGFDVTTVDIQRRLVENANYVADKMGWRLKNHLKDMRDLRFNRRFDHITSVCVYEHIPIADRIEINKKIKDLLVDGGKFSITFDYRNPSKLVQIGSPKDVYGQFVAVSGLKTRGNIEFYDNQKNYLLHPFYHKDFRWKAKVWSVLNGQFPFKDIFKIKNCNDYTFGALFLEK